MKLIAVSPELVMQKRGARATLQRQVELTMSEKDGRIHSASGMTAAIAINFCEANGFSYLVTAMCVVEGGSASYFVERINEKQT